MAESEPLTAVRMLSGSREGNPAENTHALSRESRSAPVPGAMRIRQVREVGVSRMTADERAAEIKLFKDLREEANEATKHQQDGLKVLGEHTMQLGNKACNTESVRSYNCMVLDLHRRRLIHETMEEIRLCKEKINKHKSRGTLTGETKT